MSRPPRVVLALLTWCFLATAASSQDAESTSASRTLSGAVSITNKGISTIPSFTLGKPAVLFDLSMGWKRLSFEPTLRFALEGRPWTFLFWWRYRPSQSGRFRYTVGAHPALSFRTNTRETDGVTHDVIEVRRFFAGELSTRYSVTENVGVGTYYLYSRGLETTVTRNTSYIGVNVDLSSGDLAGEFVFSARPQVYYLRLDDLDGLYVVTTLTLSKKDLPLSFSALLNKTIRTDIAGEEFLWNVTLVYLW